MNVTATVPKSQDFPILIIIFRVFYSNFLIFAQSNTMSYFPQDFIPCLNSKYSLLPYLFIFNFVEFANRNVVRHVCYFLQSQKTINSDEIVNR